MTTIMPTIERQRRIVLRAEDVWKSYDEGAIGVLRGVDFVGFEGETVALCGPSGCGKSTLLHLLGGLDEAEFSFTAQLIPVERGILETIYFRAPGVSSAEELVEIYTRRYADEPFVRVYPLGAVPEIRDVDRTNYCDIGVRFDRATGRGVVVSAIDNLVKGAAGQAIQNMNLALGFEETAGLL